MRWLKSTSQKQWMAKGKIIPSFNTNNNDYLVLQEPEYNELIASPVVKSLISEGDILVLNEEPAELKNSLDNLQTTNASLKMRNAELEAQVAELKKKKAHKEPVVDVEAIRKEAQEAIKAEAIAELQQKEDEIAELKRQLEEAEASKE